MHTNLQNLVNVFYYSCDKKQQHINIRLQTTDPNTVPISVKSCVLTAIVILVELCPVDVSYPVNPLWTEHCLLPRRGFRRMVVARCTFWCEPVWSLHIIASQTADTVYWILMSVVSWQTPWLMAHVWLTVAGVLYMKNMIVQYWEEGDEAKPADPPAFIIHENDKQIIRDHIVEAVIAASNPIRWHVGRCCRQFQPVMWCDILSASNNNW